jgi:hypothetical protein
MGGSVSGIVLVVVFAAIAVCCGLLTVRLYRSAPARPAGPADPDPGDPGEPDRG